jgi:hypothetical protein
MIIPTQILGKEVVRMYNGLNSSGQCPVLGFGTMRTLRVYYQTISEPLDLMVSTTVSMYTTSNFLYKKQ